MDGGLEWIISDYIDQKITNIHQHLSISQRKLLLEIEKNGTDGGLANDLEYPRVPSSTIEYPRVPPSTPECIHEGIA